jgi:hypothetical protein
MAVYKQAVIETADERDGSKSYVITQYGSSTSLVENTNGEISDIYQSIMIDWEKLEVGTWFMFTNLRPFAGTAEDVASGKITSVVVASVDPTVTDIDRAKSAAASVVNAAAMFA